MNFLVFLRTTISGLLMLFSFSTAAEPIDSLKHLVKNLADNESKVNTLNEISKLYAFSNTDSLNYYNKASLNLAQKLDFQEGLMLAYKYECYANSMSNKQHEAIESAKQSSEIARKLGDSTMMAANFNNIALLHDKLGNLETAIEFMELSHQYYPSYKGGEKLFIYYQNLALYYAKINHLAKAKSLVEQAQMLCDKEKLTYQSKKLNLVRAYIEFKEKDYEKAKTSVNEVLDAAIKQKDRSFEAACHEIHAEVLLKLNQLTEAKTAVKKAITIAKQEIGSNNMFTLYNILGKIEMALGNNQVAEKILKDNLVLAKDSPNKKHLSSAYLDLSESRARQHKSKEAFILYRKHREIEEELALDMRSKMMSTLNFKNRLEDQQNENQYLLKEQAQNKLIIKQNRKLNGWVTIASLLLMITFVQYFRAFNKQKQVNQELSSLVEERTNEILDLNSKFNMELFHNQENEKTRISKELHDHIGHELLILKHDLVRSQDKNAALKVDSILEDVRNISKGLHPVTLSQFGLTKALENLTERTDKSTDIVFSHKLVNVDQYFGYQNALNIYRVVQEAFTNVIKHSKASAAQLQISFSSDEINISVRDNGIGFKTDSQINNGLGVFSISQRINAMNGRFAFTENKPKGTILNINLPLET